MAQEQKRYTIQEVVDLLQAEFPVTASNLRYWEKQGLLQPGRTEGGHRVFDEEDLARIRLIKRLQSKRAFSLESVRRYLQSGLPLDEIARHLDETEWLYRPVGFQQGFEPKDLSSLMEHSGLNASEVAALEEHELLAPFNEGDAHALYDEDAVATAELAARFMRVGLAPEDFIPLKEGAAQLAKTHIELFVSKLYGPGSDPGARALMPEAEHFVRLLYHHQLLKVAQRLAKEGFFSRFEHATTSSPVPHPREESK